MAWPLAEAKNKLSEVMRLALEEGPQKITRRGESVILIAEEALTKLRSTKKDFKQFLLNSSTDAFLNLEDDPDGAGDITQ